MIEIERVVLRPMRLEGAHALLAVFSDPKIMAPFGVITFDPGDMVGWVRRNLAHQVRFGYGLFTIVRKQDGLPIGDCGLEHLDDDTAETEIGYDLRSDHWGRGLATEATAVCDHAFGDLGIARLICLIRHGSDPSRRNG